MSSLLVTIIILILLCTAALAGRVLHRLLPEAHRSPLSFEFVRSVSALLITFTALVLSLLLSEVNNDFSTTSVDVENYASMFITLDTELEQLGAPADPSRRLLRDYVAAVIASTWPEEAPPSGSYPKAKGHAHGIDAANLGRLLNQVETDVRRIVPRNAEAEKLQTACLSRISSILDQRWKLVAEAQAAISAPLLVMMVLWLMVVFASFGLTAPRGPLIAACIGMAAFSIGGAVFTILELDGPLVGIIKVSSEPMRHALSHLDRSLDEGTQTKGHL